MREEFPNKQIYNNVGARPNGSLTSQYIIPRGNLLQRCVMVSVFTVQEGPTSKPKRLFEGVLLPLLLSV